MLQRDAPVLYMEFNAWCLNAFGGHSPAAFARALWRAFTVSRTDPDGVLSAAEPGALDFLYGNLTQHGCVDDLVLQLRPDVEFPTLIEMSWPVQAREQASNRFWRVASPRRLVAAFANAIRGRDSRSLGNTLALRNAFKPIAHALRSVLGLNGVAAGISAMSLSMADTQAALHDIDARLQTLAGPAPEPEAQSASLPDMQLFSGYRPDELAILDKYHATTLRPQPGFIVDFIGTRIATDIVWTFAAERLNGAVLDVPVPGDFHAEAIEWIGVLKCVESAGNRFAVIELGAGFGTWAIASAVAARAKGIGDIRIAMVEGDPRHCASARLHFANNGFDPDAHTILHAAVGVENGIAHWPRSDAPASEDGWNHRPNFGEGDYMGRSFDDMMEVQVVAMRDLIVLEPEWNLVHIDVQGHEVDIVRSCLEEIGRRAHWIVVGTHSRKLDGDFIAMMHDAGWLLENEKPAKFTYNRGFPTLEGMTTLDGTQVWRNPRF
jgi:FkbM family methyltransferase